jgi:hypothetical protein
MSNLKEIAVILTPDQAKFLRDNCEANIEYGLTAMMMDPPLRREALERLVELTENFKGLLKAVDSAGA